MKRLETSDEPERDIICKLQKHVIIVIETTNQYQKERDLIFFDT